MFLISERPQQVENVAVYRLITSNTVEEWIYQRQIYKHSVAQAWFEKIE